MSPKIKLEIKSDEGLPHFSKEMKEAVSANMMTFDIRNKLLDPYEDKKYTALYESIDDFNVLLKLISEVYAIEQNRIRYTTIPFERDIDNLNIKAKNLALKIGIPKILALLEIVQNKILEIDTENSGIGGNTKIYGKLELLNISDNLRRALRLMGYIRVAAGLRRHLLLGDDGSPIRILAND